MRPLLDGRLLQVDGEGLHLAEQKAGQWRPGVGGSRQIAANRVERKRTGRIRRLDDVQSFPSPVQSKLDRVASFQPRQRVRGLRNAGVKIRRRVLKRAE